MKYRFCSYIYWLVVWNIVYFSIYIYILGIIIPADFHIFQRGGSTTNQIYIYICYNLII
jgi:uncharacterized membrane protein